MNNLLEAMASDMNIRQYWKETEDSFQYRIILSALGQWCLRSASSPDYSITKHSQTILLNELLETYLDLFPKIKPMFEDSEKCEKFVELLGKKRKIIK